MTSQWAEIEINVETLEELLMWENKKTCFFQRSTPLRLISANESPHQTPTQKGKVNKRLAK